MLAEAGPSRQVFVWKFAICVPDERRTRGGVDTLQAMVSGEWRMAGLLRLGAHCARYFGAERALLGRYWGMGRTHKPCFCAARSATPLKALVFPWHADCISPLGITEFFNGNIYKPKGRTMLADLSVQKMVRGAAKALAATLVSVSALSAHAAPLSVGYSDWPGWVAWQVAIDKGWFKDAGLDVKFEWFDYSASMDAFAAGKLDVVGMTNGDALVTGSGGGKSELFLITDYSSGNDQIIAKPGIKSLKDLKGKKVAVETGLVDHLLIVNALKKAGLKETDVTLVNAKTNELPQVFTAKDIAAIGVWQPVAGQALKAVPGSKAIYTSADEPGLIYDAFAAKPAVAKSRRADLLKMMKVWDKVVAYIKDPSTHADAVKIMAARSGVSPEEYETYVSGMHLLNLADGKAVYAKGTELKSIYGSTSFVNKFNVSNAVYKQSEKVESYLNPSFYEGK